jgi:hypothetical protein
MEETIVDSTPPNALHGTCSNCPNCGVDYVTQPVQEESDSVDSVDSDYDQSSEVSCPSTIIPNQDIRKYFMPIPHKVFGLFEVFEMIMVEAMDVNPLHGEMENFEDLATASTQMKWLLHTQRVSKQWRLYIQASARLRQLVGLMFFPSPIDEDIHSCCIINLNPMLFDYDVSYCSGSPDPRFAPKFAFAIACTVLERLGRPFGVVRSHAD